ncbi:hypothetical protein PINS_up004652 [Pythium insidiosum]|nr:hypothetical protein PINS_up004652 [Pythium insidiosum]
MAWVNRTTRDQGPGNFKVSTAAAHLGPGQYESSSTRKVKPNVAPFGSTAQVDRGANGAGSPGTMGQSFVTPGPGTYQSDNQAQWESPTRVQSSIFQSKTTRDTKPGSNNLDTPGPGAYTKHDSFGSKKKKHTSLGNLLVRETTPKNNKIRWARLPTAPSIPTHAQSFGYEQGPYGKLVRHEPAQVGHTGRGQDTTGPGEYDPLRGIKSIHKPRATDFSKSRVPRSMEQEIKQKADLPAPGQYADATLASPMKDAKRQSAVFKSAITREKSLEADPKHEVPGPGAYYEGYEGFTTATKPEHLQFFGSTTTRFESSQHEITSPGPGMYYSPPQLATPVRRKGKSAPFSSKKERFSTAQPKPEYVAAPGSYNLPSALDDVMTKPTSKMHSFGSTTKRFDTLTHPHERVPETLESQLERIFKSSTDRLKDKPRRALDVPGPGHYSTPTVVAQKPLHIARPDVFVCSEPRFKKPLPKVKVPGPGHYHPQSIDNEWNRPTYNISIATEMELAMLR